MSTAPAWPGQQPWPPKPKKPRGPRLKKRRKRKPLDLEKLTPSSRKLLETFDEEARSWGYVSDRGVGVEVANGQIAYDEAKDDLVRRVYRLEEELREARRQLRER